MLVESSIKNLQGQNSSKEGKQNNKPFIFAISHCLLNQEVRATGLTPHPEIKGKIMELINKYNAEIEQLPCPEFLFLGKREPKTYYEYSKIPNFYKFCDQLAENVADALKKLETPTIFVVGITRSPTCSLSLVYGKENQLRKGEGIFMKRLKRKLKGIFVEVDFDNIDGSLEKIEAVVRTTL